MTEVNQAAAYNFLERAAAYSSGVPAADLVINVGRNAVRIQVPAIDAELSSSFLEAFYNVAQPNALAEYTIRLFDDADGRLTKIFPFDERSFGVAGKCILAGGLGLKISVNPVIGSISVVDRERREIAVWVRDFKDLPYWYVATPLRDEIAAVADWLGMDFIHAAGLGRERKGICLVGRSGSGKSTTVLQGVVKGFQTVGDDFLVTDGRHLFGVYSRAKAHRDAQQFVGDFSAATIGGINEAKLILDLARLGNDNALVPEMEIAAICLPKKNAGQGMTPARRIDVVHELLIHTSIGLREVYPGSLKRMRALAQSAQCLNWFIDREGSWLEEAMDMLLEAYA